MAESKMGGRIRSLALTPPQAEVAESIRQRLEDAVPWIRARNERVAAARSRYQRALSTPSRVLPLEAPPGFADVDQERYDHVLLIDGHRGEGKTSVLMKMLDTWNQHALSRLQRSSAPSASDPSRKKKSRASDGTVTLPRGVFVVPLPTLDLPAMPRGQDVPLASLVLNCFSSLVTELVEERPVHGGPSRDPRHAPEGALDTLRDRWDWLHRSLASKYAHASKRVRDDHLQLVRELQDDTRRVYEIDDRFRLFIDALSEAVSARFALHDEPPVFVIAIDDLDLAAHATIDLLDVLRVFQHPAVFFLMTGDYENLHRCVRNAPTMLSLFSSSATEADDHRFGRSALASDVVERIFPRQNVFRLEAPKLDERLDVEWSRNEKVRPLLARLGKRVPLLNLASESSDPAQLGRLGLVLPERMRRLINLCEQLNILADSDREDLAVAVAREFWRAVLADRGLEYPRGAMREFFERRVDKSGNQRLTVAAISAESVPGSDCLVIERAGKRFELSRSSDPVKPLAVVDSEGKSAHVELAHIFAVLLEMSAAGVELDADGLPHYFNRTLVRTTFARDNNVFQLDWPLPQMSVAKFIDLRRLWAKWLAHAHIATALVDEKLSVIELYLLVIGWACEGATAGWSDLLELVSRSKTRAESLTALDALRTKAWERARDVVKSGASGAFADWLIECIPLVSTASGWDTATSERSRGVIHEIARELLRRSEGRPPQRGKRVALEWYGVSSFLIDDAWELSDAVTSGTSAESFFDRVISVRSEINAPIGTMNIEQYFSPPSRSNARGRILEILRNERLQRELRNRPPAVGLDDLMGVLRRVGAYLGAAIDTQSRVLPEDDQRWFSYEQSSFRAVMSATTEFAELTVLDVKWSMEVDTPARDWGLDRALLDIAIDSGWIRELPERLNHGVRRWPGALVGFGPVRVPILFAPAFVTPIDTDLLMDGWNAIANQARRLLPAIGRWLVLCGSVYQRRELNYWPIAPLEPKSSEYWLNEIRRVVEIEPSSSMRGKAWYQFVEALSMYTSEDVIASESFRSDLIGVLHHAPMFRHDARRLALAAARWSTTFSLWRASAQMAESSSTTGDTKLPR